MMNEFLLSTVEYGTGKKARLKGVDIAGKTGTSSHYRDAWFLGYSNKSTVGIWVGHDDATPMKKVTGGSVPAMIFRDIMEPLTALQPPGQLARWQPQEVDNDIIVNDVEKDSSVEGESNMLTRFLQGLFGE